MRFYRHFFFFYENRIECNIVTTSTARIKCIYDYCYYFFLFRTPLKFTNRFLHRLRINGFSARGSRHIWFDPRCSCTLYTHTHIYVYVYTVWWRRSVEYIYFIFPASETTTIVFNDDCCLCYCYVYSTHTIYIAVLAVVVVVKMLSVLFVRQKHHQQQPALQGGG